MGTSPSMVLESSMELWKFKKCLNDYSASSSTLEGIEVSVFRDQKVFNATTNIIEAQVANSVMSEHVSRIIKSLSLVDEEVIGIYLVGSRLWGTHSKLSDFDILVIIEDLTPSHILKSRHKNQYDVTLLTKSVFIERIKQGSFIEILCCLIEGDEIVWRTGEPVRQFMPEIGILDAWVVERNRLDYEKAKKFWIKSKTEEAFKILQHIITATVVIKGIKQKAEIVGHLRYVTLSLHELQALVLEGRNSDVTNWLHLSWSEVEAAHKTQVRGMNLSYSL